MTSNKDQASANFIQKTEEEKVYGCRVLTTGCHETRHTFYQLGSRLGTPHTQEARINELFAVGWRLERI